MMKNPKQFLELIKQYKGESIDESIKVIAKAERLHGAGMYDSLRRIIPNRYQIGALIRGLPLVGKLWARWRGWAKRGNSLDV